MWLLLCLSCRLTLFEHLLTFVDELLVMATLRGGLVTLEVCFVIAG